MIFLSRTLIPLQCSFYVADRCKFCIFFAFGYQSCFRWPLKNSKIFSIGYCVKELTASFFVFIIINMDSYVLFLYRAGRNSQCRSVFLRHTKGRFVPAQ